MSASRKRRGQWQRRLVDPPRAVIDIGSNTVRLVIFEGTARAPETVWNEKVAARLGRDLSATGRIPNEAAKEALAALARYSVIVRDREIDDVQTVATAAARDAENGAKFLANVAALGLKPRLLSGEEEACASAFGAIGAFPGANGMIADLGGGSLELVTIGDGTCRNATSLPFGTLRLGAMRAGSADFAAAVHEKIAEASLTERKGQPLYMIGGTWRALAYYAMAVADYPLTDPHGFRLSRDEATAHCERLVNADPDQLAGISGVSAMRASYLPDASALLIALMNILQPSQLVFSSWGIREGLLFMRLTEQKRALDPLLAGVNAFAEARHAPLIDATRIAGWTSELANGNGAQTERLRLAAAQLASALQRVEPNLRANHAEEWALDKRWIDCPASDRAMLCAALYGSLGRTSLPRRANALANTDELRESITWGLAFRLARRLGAGSRIALAHSRLRMDSETVTLHLDESRSALATDMLERELGRLAEWVNRRPQIVIEPAQVGQVVA